MISKTSRVLNGAWIAVALSCMQVSQPVSAQNLKAPTGLSGWYLRGNLHQQQHAKIALFDNLPAQTALPYPPGPGTWFGYAQLPNPYTPFFPTYTIPGVPNDGDRQRMGNASGLELALGLRLAPWARAELAWANTQSARVSFDYPLPTEQAFFDVKSRQLMLNAYLDIAPLLPHWKLGVFQPYVMAGLGRSRNSNSDYFCTVAANCGGVSQFANASSSSQSAWQIGVGTQIALSQRWMLDVSYRRLDLGEIRGANVFLPLASWGLNGKVKAQRLSMGLVMNLD
jgi:opacity protein-like surface antigen